MDKIKLLGFRLDGHDFAFPFSCVKRVERMVATTPLPGAPAAVLGVIDIAGRIVPVADPRPKFGLPEKPLMLSDQMILLRTRQREMAVRVDSAGDVFEAEREEYAEGDTVWPGLSGVDGIARTSGGIVLIRDPDRFFTPGEDTVLTAALESFGEDTRADGMKGTGASAVSSDFSSGSLDLPDGQGAASDETGAGE